MSLSVKVLLIAFAQISVSLSAQSIPKTAPLTFTTIEVPGADVTDVNGINSAGVMVGDYIIGNQPFGAFILHSGNLTLFRYRNFSTNAFGVNDSGVIVGRVSAGGESGFIYDGTTFKIFKAPGMSYTVMSRINGGGLIAGNAGAINNTSPFEYHDGKFQEVLPGGAFHPVLTGLNDLGAVVGYADPVTPFSRSFEYVNGTGGPGLRCRNH